MDWKALGVKLEKFGLPLLGAALVGPSGIAIGTKLADALGQKDKSPEAMLATLTSNPEALEKAKEFELNNRKDLIRMAYEHELDMRKQDSSEMTLVNQTMQAEYANSANETWLQKSWRPMNGMALALGTILSVVLVFAIVIYAIYSKNMTPISYLAQIVSALAMVLGLPAAVCGITAWHRGVTQRIEAGDMTSMGVINKLTGKI